MLVCAQQKSRSWMPQGMWVVLFCHVSAVLQLSCMPHGASLELRAPAQDISRQDELRRFVRHCTTVLRSQRALEGAHAHEAAIRRVLECLREGLWVYGLSGSMRSPVPVFTFRHHEAQTRFLSQHRDLTISLARALLKAPDPRSFGALSTARAELNAEMRVHALLALLFLRDTEGAEIVRAVREREERLYAAGRPLGAWSGSWYLMLLCDRVVKGLRPGGQVEWSSPRPLGPDDVITVEDEDMLPLGPPLRGR